MSAPKPSRWAPARLCEPSDYITSTHRGHGHTIAKGGDPRRMMAELMGRADGYNKGKGGSMHIAAVDMGMLGATGIVGSAMPIAVGAALTAKTLGRSFVTICFHGDGATNQGVWHESINLAAAWDLPVIFLCENNQWAISMPYDQATRNPTVSDRARGYGIPGITVDGFNPFAVYDAVKDAAERARSGAGPTLIEARFFRYIGHFVADDESYRDTECNRQWERFDPIARMASYLVEEGVVTPAWIEAADAEALAAVQDATELRQGGPRARTRHALRGPLLSGLHAPAGDRPMTTRTPPGPAAAAPATRRLTVKRAINETLREEMQRDPTIIILGCDVGIRGNPFGVTRGLYDEFGPARVLDTPISEAAIVGSSLGAAATGLRPVAEILFSDWITIGMDQLVNQIAKIRYMFGGAISVPLVIRAPVGAGGGQAAQHSQSLRELVQCGPRVAGRHALHASRRGGPAAHGHPQ